MLSHLTAIVLVAASEAPLALKLAASLAVLVLAWLAWRRWRLATPACVRAMRQRGTDWWLETGAGEGLRVSLLPTGLIWRTILVLQFQSLDNPRQRLQAVVFRDAVGRETFRRLYVLLRWQNRVTEDDAHGNADSQ